MGFASVKDLTDAYDAGRVHTAFWRKTWPSFVLTNGQWSDTTTNAGQPNPFYYASEPLTGATIAQGPQKGLYHGGDVGPTYTKYIHKHRVNNQASLPVTEILVDLLMYYPFFDEALVNEEQVTTNPVTLPRATSGEGVRMFATSVAPHSAGGNSTFTVKYTNSEGVAGRTSLAAPLSPLQTLNGTLLHGGSTGIVARPALGPFIPLQSGDTGVRSVEGVTVGSPGETGLFTIVLCRPLLTISTPGTTAGGGSDAAMEVDCFQHRSMLPVVEDGAYLSRLSLGGGNTASLSMFNETTFVWG